MNFFLKNLKSFGSYINKMLFLLNFNRSYG